ncbi:MAG: MMPL family transporter [Planctomycetes bacterium]|nr:MMPL family transporter [Planctomycetota bacterium]
MSRGEGRQLVAGALAFAGLLAHVLLQLRVTTDITHFLPGGEPDSRIELARRIATGEPSRTMVLLVDARDADEAAAVSRAFEHELRAEPRVAAALAALDGGPPTGVEAALWSLYQPRRLAFLAADAAAARERIADAGMAAAVATLKQRLASPMSALVSRVAPADPFLVLPRLFERTSGGAGGGSGIGVHDERFVTTDGTGAVLFLTTSAGAADSTVQRPLLAGVAAAFAAVGRAHGGHLRLSCSGAHRHAVAAEDAMRADIQRVSIGSIAGLVLLFVLLFRSLRPALMCLPVLGTGFLAGTSACLLAFGEVHGLTLAFGASLLGVAIDYALHFHAHHALAPAAEGPRATLRRLWPHIALGALTTITAFLALLLAAFPGLRELALFAATGLAAALLQTWLLLPGCAGPSRPTAAARRLAAALDAALRPGRGWFWLPTGAALLLTAIGLPALRWNDGVATLNRIDPALKAEDDAVQARVARFEQRRVVVATGADDQAALERNDRATAVLAAAARDGLLAGHAGPGALLPSAARQREVDAAVRGDPTLGPRLAAALASAGFVADAFAPFHAALAAEAPPPLSPDDLRDTPLWSLVRPFRATGPQGIAFANVLYGLRDEAGLRARVEALDGVYLLDIEDALTGALAGYRGRMQELLLLGLLAVIALVALRRRRLRATLVACGPAVLAAAATMAALGLAGVDLNLLSLVALLMVVSMGVDYGIFLSADGEPAAARAATLFAILLASLTTSLGFGLLSLSAQPALFRIGVTSGIGILLCLVLALSLGAALTKPRS